MCNIMQHMWEVLEVGLECRRWGPLPVWQEGLPCTSETARGPPSGQLTGGCCGTSEAVPSLAPLQKLQS